ncbi:hypothetical protein CY35_19G038700 [Sphagnum magellanicum]|nr:hypothetical protein CY35_19G038700 [Sphagnum magellanicum]
MAIVTSITILVFLGGSLVSYFIITGDVFEPIFTDWFGENSLFADRRVVIVLFATLVVLPLSLKRSLQDLKWSSTISVTMLTYLTVTLGIIGVAKFSQEGIPQEVNFFRGGMHALIGVDIVVFSFHCHIQVMPIFAELADEPNPFFHEGWNWGLREPLLSTENEAPILQKGSSRVKCMDGVILISMTTCFIGYCLVGEFGYLLFPDVESDLLKSFGSSNPFINFSRIGMAVVSMVCYPVCHYPCRTILDDATRYVLQGRIKEGFSWTLHVILTLVLCGAALGTSLLTSDLGTVFSIVGSTGGVLVVFIIPGLILIHNKLGEHRLPVLRDTEAPSHGEEVVHPRNRVKYIRIGGGCVLMCFGFLIFLITAYVTVKGKENV